MKRILLAFFPAMLLCALPGCRGSETVRIMTYNVGTFTKFEENSLLMITDMVKETGADVISMNELDSCTVRTGGVFQLERFASEMGEWQYRFGAAMPYDGGAYGDGLATGRDAEVLDSWSAVLPQGDGAEPRALVVMEFDSYVVASTHLDHVSPEAQLGQVRAITGMLEARYSGGRKPVFLCGDVNAVPGSDTMKEFELHWDVISPEENTFPSDVPDCCIDYILAMKGTGKFEVVRSAVLRDFASGDTAAASDHLPVYAEVKVAR
ncbi:MAG: endonuclease/exonuclease/phosphatase family protein [Bacteroidetes bacterium]|uniref:Endonuclease/exonuclease/phosphatase family protein n=1 Tax=Candidatus Cryptobacteroides avicola TaxID=2840757 RepID=A0A940DQK2_9BACT|nr:endonuclease/exonuclease/phosphatase family protein [Candidatus Cryptobacteroides avicola]